MYCKSSLILGKADAAFVVRNDYLRMLDLGFQPWNEADFLLAVPLPFHHKPIFMNCSVNLVGNPTDVQKVLRADGRILKKAN